jgi:hypothetical protein
MTYRKLLSFRFRLSFLTMFRWILRFAAASGLVVAWSTLATLRSLRNPKTLCLI